MGFCPCSIPLMPVPYVNQQTAATIKAMEQKLHAMSEEAGVLFISVTGVPEETGASKVFFVRLGLTKSLSKDAGEAVIRSALRDEIAGGAIIQSAIYFGIRGAAGDKSHEGAGSAPS